MYEPITEYYIGKPFYPGRINKDQRLGRIFKSHYDSEFTSIKNLSEHIFNSKSENINTNFDFDTLLKISVSKTLIVNNAKFQFIVKFLEV